MQADEGNRPRKGMVPRAAMPNPTDGLLVTVLLICADVTRSADFYRTVLGAETAFEGPPPVLRLANTWLQLATAGGPTPDKPTIRATLPRRDEFSTALNIRVPDIYATYQAWSTAGAKFLTPPVAVPSALRCFCLDPDGRLIELAQLTDSTDA